MGYRLTMPDGEVRDVPRVTEVIRSAMARPALHEWELRSLAEWCLGWEAKKYDTGAQILAAFRRDHARHANRGTAVHKWIAAVLTGGPQPVLMKSQAGYKTAFTNFMVDHLSDLSGALVETTLTDDRVSVAGTADLVCAGHLYDWKTVEKKNGRGGIWPDQLAQLGAYASMDRVVEHGRIGRRVPAVKAASVVRLYADGRYETTTICGSELHDAVALWYAVKRVAAATMKDRDRSARTQKENSHA